MNPSNAPDEVTEDYLVRKYCVARQHARRILKQYGRHKADLDVLLGAQGRTQIHRRQDVRRTESEVSFG